MGKLWLASQLLAGFRKLSFLCQGCGLGCSKRCIRVFLGSSKLLAILTGGIGVRLLLTLSSCLFFIIPAAVSPMKQSSHCGPRVCARARLSSPPLRGATLSFTLCVILFCMTTLLRYNAHTLQFATSSVHFVVFSVFTDLCSHHLSQF